MMKMRDLLLLFLALALALGAKAVWLDLPPSGTKCVSEEIQPNVVVLADYSVVYEGQTLSSVTIAAKEISCFHPHNVLNIPVTLVVHLQHLSEIWVPAVLVGISTQVTSPYGNTLHHKENVKTGQFAFTTTEPGNYLACFWIDSADKGVGASVNLDWKIGIAAKDWDSVARKEKIEGVGLELTKLEALVQAIHENLMYLRTREAEMREVSEKTNARVAWFSIMSLGVCIVVSVLQLWHLKTFFRKKKLI